MKTKLLRLGLTILVVGLLVGGVIWNFQISDLRRRTTTVEIYALSLPGGKSRGLSCRLQGSKAYDAAANFQRRRDGFCNICLNPDSNNWYRLNFLSKNRLIDTIDVQMDSGQIYPYSHGCLDNLTQPSLRYFSLLIAKQKALAP